MISTYIHSKIQITWKLLKLGILFFGAVSLFSGCKNFKHTEPVKPNLVVSFDSAFNTEHGSFNFMLVSDWGRNGFYNQKEVANGMVKIAEIAEPEFIISCGDNFQVNGVASINDPLWKTSFEDIYIHPSLLVNWYPVLGNHDYKGNTEAEIKYSQISRRWRMPSHYYTFTQNINDSISARFIFLDTPPLVNEYYEELQNYPDIANQDSAKQMKWLKYTLANAKEQWIFVSGHHPIYSASPKHGNTEELISKLNPMFKQYKVDFYFCGHDHDLQHLKPAGNEVDYIVTGAGSEVRETGKNENSKISIANAGFTFVSIQGKTLTLNFISKEGKVLYKYTKIKK